MGRERRRLGGLVGRDEFGIVLALLVAAYTANLLPPKPLAGTLVTVIVVGALLAALLACRPRPVAVAVIGGGLVLVWVATGLSSLESSDDVTFRVRRVAEALVLFFTLVLLLQRVLASDKVGLQSLSGALSAYLLIGLMFSDVFAAVAGPQGMSFFASHVAATAENLQYFSFTTLTTLGYGDLTAAANPGRGLAVLEAMLGQVFLATLVARLVSRYERPHRVRSRGAPPSSAEGSSAEGNEHAGDD